MPPKPPSVARASQSQRSQGAKKANNSSLTQGSDNEDEDESCNKEKYEPLICSTVGRLMACTSCLRPISRAVILQQFKKISRKDANYVLKQICKELKVYGVKLVKISNSTNYILVSPNKTKFSSNDCSPKTKLLGLILSFMVFYDERKISKDSLFSNLEKLGIDILTGCFGNVARQIKEFQNHAFITETVIANRTWYSWGPRAIAEVNKNALLDYLARVLGVSTESLPKELKNRVKGTEVDSSEDDSCSDSN